jgi:general secretion pathway protein M
MTALQQSLAAHWRNLMPREKTGLIIAAVVLGAFALWALLLAPALQTLKSADANRQALDGQLQKMQRLQATAIALQAQSKSSRDTQVRALERTLKPLGSGVQLQVSGAQLTLTLRQIPAAVLADWLIQVRNQARMQATEFRLTRNAAASEAAWDGTLVYSLPPG